MKVIKASAKTRLEIAADSDLKRDIGEVSLMEVVPKLQSIVRSMLIGFSNTKMRLYKNDNGDVIVVCVREKQAAIKSMQLIKLGEMVDKLSRTDHVYEVELSWIAEGLEFSFIYANGVEIEQ